MELRPWMHVITVLPGAVGINLCNTGGGDPTKLLPAFWLFGISGLIGWGLEWRMYDERKRNRMVFERAYSQPTIEEQNIKRAREQAYSDAHLVTGGNVNIEIPKAPEVVKPKQELRPEMEAYKFEATTPVLDDAYTRRVIKRICQRQIHQRAQYPDGDYREKSWLRTFGGPFSRDELVIARDILAFAGGIIKKGSASNSPYVTIDWTVIELGARGNHLPHPDYCKCADCSAAK